MTAPELNQTIAAVYRDESPRLIARLMRVVRDLGRAEELAQDALVAALEQWPRDGIPRNPGAWLVTTARHHAINAARRSKMIERKSQQVAHAIEADHEAPDLDRALDDDIGDDLLRLMFTACHPALSIEARVALTLRLLGGLSTDEIARAFLVPEPTIAQRIVRAKRTIAEEKVPFEAPRGEELAARLPSILGVIYLIFNEGYSATAGDDYLRPQLCDDALRLGRFLAGLLPDEPEVHGLVALMELHASRSAARVDAAGEPVLLLDQDRGRWARDRIDRGLTALARAESLGGAYGLYALQAAIAACHARALVADQTDWARIASLYGVLTRVTPSSVVRLNRAMAVAMAEGPAAGLALIDELRDVPALQQYHLLPGARADLLERLGRHDEARSEFLLVAALTRNAREQRLLTERAAACEQVMKSAPGDRNGG